MLKVMGKYYATEMNQRNFNRTFDDWDQLYDFLYNQAVEFKSYYGSGDGLFDIGAYVHCQSSDWKGPISYRLPKEPHDLDIHTGCVGGYLEHLWIKLIESERGVEFSSGQLTGGRKHRSKRFEEWALEKSKQAYEPEFKFAD